MIQVQATAVMMMLVAMLAIMMLIIMTAYSVCDILLLIVVQCICQQTSTAS